MLIRRPASPPALPGIWCGHDGLLHKRAPRYRGRWEGDRSPSLFALSVRG